MTEATPIRELEPGDTLRKGVKWFTVSSARVCTHWDKHANRFVQERQYRLQGMYGVILHNEYSLADIEQMLANGYEIA